MAVTNTTLASACGASDTTIVVASSSGFAAGYQVVIDGEVMKVAQNYTTGVNGVNVPVLRGLSGGVAFAHPTSAKVRVAATSDTVWGEIAPQTQSQYPNVRGREVRSYSAAGAITLPDAGADMVAVINGTSICAMTVADPSTVIDGSLLWIASNGAAAHTVTFASGLSGTGASGSYDVITVNASAPVLLGPFMAIAGYWQAAVAVPMAGTVTNVTATVA